MGMNNQSVVYIFVSSVFFQQSCNGNEKKFYVHFCIYALMVDSFDYCLIFLFKTPDIKSSDCPDSSSVFHQVYE